MPKEVFRRELYNGQLETFEAVRKCNIPEDMCFECDGFGIIQIGSCEGDYVESCQSCKGTGEAHIQIHIPMRVYRKIKSELDAGKHDL